MNRIDLFTYTFYYTFFPFTCPFSSLAVPSSSCVRFSRLFLLAPLSRRRYAFQRPAYVPLFIYFSLFASPFWSSRWGVVTWWGNERRDQGKERERGWRIGYVSREGQREWGKEGENVRWWGWSKCSDLCGSFWRNPYRWWQAGSCDTHTHTHTHIDIYNALIHTFSYRKLYKRRNILQTDLSECYNVQDLKE